MATLSDVVKQLQSQQENADQNAEKNTRSLGEVKGSILKLIESQKPTAQDRENAVEASKRARVASRVGGVVSDTRSGLMGGITSGLGLNGVGGMIGSILGGALKGVSTLLYGVGFAAATALKVGGLIFLAPIIGNLVSKLIETTLQDIDIPFFGNNAENKKAIADNIGSGVKWSIYGSLIARLLGKRFGVIFAVGGWAYQYIDSIFDDAEDESFVSELEKGADSWFGSGNGQTVIAGIGAAIAAGVANFMFNQVPKALSYLNPFSKSVPAPADPMRDPTQLRTTPTPRRASSGPVPRFNPADIKLGETGLKPAMFKADDLLDKNGNPLKGQVLENKMSSLAKAGKILPEAVGDIMKTPWYKSLGPAMGAVSKTLLAVANKAALPLLALDAGTRSYDLSSQTDNLTAGVAGLVGSVSSLADVALNLPNMGVNAIGNMVGFNPGLKTDFNISGSIEQGIVDMIEATKDSVSRLWDRVDSVPIIKTTSDLVAPPRASNNQYTDSFGAPVKPSQFFNSVNNQQFESFYFGGGTSLDVYDATGLKLSWR
jgi:hypothetical protein